MPGACSAKSRPDVQPHLPSRFTLSLSFTLSSKSESVPRDVSLFASPVGSRLGSKPPGHSNRRTGTVRPARLQQTAHPRSVSCWATKSPGTARARVWCVSDPFTLTNVIPTLKQVEPPSMESLWRSTQTLSNRPYSLPNSWNVPNDTPLGFSIQSWSRTRTCLQLTQSSTPFSSTTPIDGDLSTAYDACSKPFSSPSPAIPIPSITNSRITCATSSFHLPPPRPEHTSPPKFWSTSNPLTRNCRISRLLYGMLEVTRRSTTVRVRELGV